MNVRKRQQSQRKRRLILWRVYLLHNLQPPLAVFCILTGILAKWLERLRRRVKLRHSSGQIKTLRSVAMSIVLVILRSFGFFIRYRFAFFPRLLLRPRRKNRVLFLSLRISLFLGRYPLLVF